MIPAPVTIRTLSARGWHVTISPWLWRTGI